MSNTGTASPSSLTARVRCEDLLDAARALAPWRELSPETRPSPSTLLEFPRLDAVTRKFDLSEIEETFLLLLALEEVGASAADPRRPSIALSFSEIIRIAPATNEPRLLLPGAPLRRWRLIESSARRFDAVPLVHQPLRVSDRLLGHLLGADTPDERLAPALDFSPPLRVITPAQSQCAQAIAAAWDTVPHFEAFAPVAVRGKDLDALRAVAWESAHLAGFQVAEMRLSSLPESAAERREWVRLWQVEALLAQRALFLDATNLDQAGLGLLREWLSNPGGVVIVAHHDDLALPTATVRFSVPETTALDRAQLIGAALNGHGPKEPEFTTRVASQFNLGAVALFEACRDTEAAARAYPALTPASALWRACRERARARLGPLVQIIESSVSWEDLILPEENMATLREAVAQVRSRAKVHETWGFAAKSTRGLNLTALFSGPSGTGKTLAAEVIANDLGLDLLRVDLSSVVSKYIGETEKHLSEIFDAAETGAAVVLFDEADALFGPRSKVTDSRDRHANIEVSYLLQRLEAFRGLAILTTNFRENLDQAFLRRIRFHVEFPFPDRATRARLWRSAFPSATPLGAVDFERFSRLSFTGGHIRNIALNAAFLAANEDTPVQPRHLVSAARGEFRKSEKPVPEGDLRALADLGTKSEAPR